MQAQKQKSSYTQSELVACGEGKLFGENNAKLPLPPMLMFDRIMHIDAEGGTYGKGEIIAELDIKPDLWFFGCHFRNDPVMPGCLGVDAVWQLLGFYLAWRGGAGKGRALGSGDIKFSGQITPDKKQVTYIVNVNRVILRKLVLGVADADVIVDGETVYTVKNLKVGLFTEEDRG